MLTRDDLKELGKDVKNVKNAVDNERKTPMFVNSQVKVKATAELNKAVAGDLATDDETNPKNIDLIGAAWTEARPLHLHPTTVDPKGKEEDGDVFEDQYGPIEEV